MGVMTFPDAEALARVLGMEIRTGKRLAENTGEIVMTAYDRERLLATLSVLQEILQKAAPAAQEPTVQELQKQREKQRERLCWMS